jgi:SH3-like domain-containing protein
MEVYYEVYNTYTDQEDPYLNLRSEPHPKSKIIAKLSDGTELIELTRDYGSKGKWMKVRVQESGAVGYVHSKWIRKIYEN